MTESNPSVLDLFAGPGGLSLGFRKAGYSVIGGVENDDWSFETYHQNHSRDSTIAIKADIREITLRGRVDIVVGGPPCQGFSMVGRPKIAHLRENNGRGWHEDSIRNRLYQEFIRIVELLKPQFFVMENVPGIISFNSGKTKNKIIERFKDAGYENTEVRILNAADYGVPQIRKRAIFIGNRLKIENPYPRITHTDKQHSLQSRIDENLDLLDQWIDVFGAISDLPALRAGEGSDEMDYATKPLSRYQKQLRSGSIKLFNHKARMHSERDIRLFKMLKEGDKMSDLPEEDRPYRSDIFSDKMKKQSWKKPSSAILAHMQKDGLMYIHPDRDQARSFTPREAARLQSFPDSYRFYGPMTQQFRQIGNAVPPILAYAVARAMRPYISPVKNPLIEYDRSSNPKDHYELMSTP